MHRQSKLPARFLLVLLGTVLIAVGMTSVSLARTETEFHGTNDFIILEATSTKAYFTIDDDCGDIDENCTVVVIRDPGHQDTDNNGYEDEWKDEVDNDNCLNLPLRSGENGRNKDFDTCWAGVPANARYFIEWPVINPDDDFEITPYCQSGDEVCAEELIVCYNAGDCDDNSFYRDQQTDFTQVGDLWDEAGSCLYDDDEDDVWECLDDALDDWLDDNMRSNDDYDDLEDEEEDERGFTLEDYENDLDDVGNRPSTRRSETVLERYQRQWAARTPISIYQSMNEVDTRGPSFRLTADEFLTVNFTAFLESTSPYQICNTTIGCVTVTTYSNTFRSYMQNLHIVIQDRSVLRCMDRAGWDVDDDHVIPFDNPDLIFCDERIKVANEACPAKDTGASDDLFAMWDTGLLRGILPDSFAQGLRLQVERARDRTPECLCAAGFAENNFVVTPENTEGPWERSGALRTEDVCD
ncbi:MAG: hypothetical protein F4X16_06425 [Caldilineaceae bacterium SB0661_bin_34]|nr:hypothetical protein [Caldilineaceae bacterium SB0661_bin_34]